MKEIKIVLNNNPETFDEDPFSIYIDNTELKNFKKFSLIAEKLKPKEEGCLKYFELDDMIKYSVDYFAPYFEEEN